MRAHANPLVLRHQIDDLIVQLLSRCLCWKHSRTVNVFETMIKEADYSLGNIIN